MSNLKTRVSKISSETIGFAAGRLKEAESSIRNLSKDNDSKNIKPRGRCSSSPPPEGVSPQVKLPKKSQPLARSASKRAISSKAQALERRPGNRPVPFPSKTGLKQPKAVPVRSTSGKPLMPCHPARARELVRKRKAIRRFKKGFFYIQLTERENGSIQTISSGLDPGSKREGYTTLSEKKMFLNILADAITWVKKAVKTRRVMRRGRRQRKTPCRQNRKNRTRGGLPPSTKARWAWKLRICELLAFLYPISVFVVEDISAKTKKGARKWNRSFSPLEVGKRWFYEELRKLAPVILKKGYETKELREKFGLPKLSNKLSESFYAHNVDSYVLARSYFQNTILPNDTSVIRIVPIRLYRRELHALQPSKGGIRRPYGSTRSMGFKRGSLIQHSKYGICYVGGTSKNKISLHDVGTGIRLTQSAKIEECQFLAYNAWRVWAIPHSTTRVEVSLPIS